MRGFRAAGRLAAAVLALMLAWPAAAQQAFTPEQKAAMETVIRDYLVANPEVIAEALHELERRQKIQEEIAQARRLQEHKAAIFASADDFVHNPDGRIPVVEFFDYQCGYCKRVLPAVQKLRADAEDVRIIFKEYPILGPVSTYAARAAIASRAQGKYMEFHDLLMGNRGRLTERAVLDLATKAGLDVARLQKDMASPEVQAVIQRNLTLGQTMGVRGTPAMYIGDTYVPGAVSYGQMVAMVESARENCTVC